MWRRGCGDRLLAARPDGQGAARDPDLADFSGAVSDSGEGRWTVAGGDRRGRAGARAHRRLYARFARAARARSATGCCRPCARSSAATSNGPRGRRARPASTSTPEDRDDTWGPAVRADALVLFGITGDLAKKKLFPALYGMFRRQRLTCPGHRRGARAPGRTTTCAGTPTTPSPHAARLRRGGVRRVCAGLLDYVAGDYRRAGDLRDLAAALQRARRPLPVRYLAIPPSLFDDGRRGPGRRRPAPRRRVVVEKPFGPRPGVGPGAERRPAPALRRVGDLPHRPLPRQGARPEPVGVPLRQLAPRADLEPPLRRAACRSPWRRRSASRAGARFYDPVGRAARRGAEPPAADGLPAGHGAAGLGHADALRDETVKVMQAMRSLEPGALVRGQYAGYRDEASVAPDSDTETFVAARAPHRLVALGGRALLRARRQGARRHGHRGAGRVPRAAPLLFADGRPPTRARTTCASA